MKSKGTDVFSEETHPWLWYAPKGCTILIIGTFPTAMKNRAFDFYYPNTRNLFWKVMAQLAGSVISENEGLPAVRERKEILDKLKIAVTDMGYRIGRYNGSSLDARLTALELMDIFRILDENPGISKIILTSSSGKASAFGWFKNYLYQKNHPMDISIGLLPFSGWLDYIDRHISITVVPSTSPAAAIGFDRLLEIYRKEVLSE